MLRDIRTTGLIEGKVDGTHLSDGRDRQGTFGDVASLSCGPDPVVQTGLLFDEGLLGVGHGIGITDMIAHPFRWHLIAGKGLAEPDDPSGLTLGHVVALGTLEGKSHGTEP